MSPGREGKIRENWFLSPCFTAEGEQQTFKRFYKIFSTDYWKEKRKKLGFNYDEICVMEEHSQTKCSNIL